MKGNLLIKGNFYTTNDIEISKNGMTIHAQKDVILLSKNSKLKLNAGDVFIEDISNKLKIKEVVAFSELCG